MLLLLTLITSVSLMASVLCNTHACTHTNTHTHTHSHTHPHRHRHTLFFSERCRAGRFGGFFRVDRETVVYLCESVRVCVCESVRVCMFLAFSVDVVWTSNEIG